MCYNDQDICLIVITVEGYQLGRKFTLLPVVVVKVGGRTLKRFFFTVKIN